MTQPKPKIDVGHCKVLDVSQIEPSPLNVRLLEDFQEREDRDEFVELCNSIRQDGLIQPIIVRKVGNDGKYEAIAGSRRLHALKYVGVKQAPTIVREMEDNDVRIASLVENIHREDIDRETKETSLKDIYANAKSEWKDVKLVEKYLSVLNSRRHAEKTGKKFKSQRFEIPKSFEDLCDRIGWSPGYQYNIIRGYDFRSYSETNYGAELDDETHDMLNEYPEFSMNAKGKLREEIESEISGLDNRKALKKVRQFVHDIRTGAIKQDEETGEFRYYPSKAEDISKIETEVNPAQAREQIMNVGKVLFKLITGTDIEMSDVHVAERQAQSMNAKENMHQICTHSLEMRELRVLQDLVIPLNIAIDKLIDEIEKAK